MNSSYNFKILRVLRGRLNLTLDQLAERSGLTCATVGALEANRTQPSLKTLDAIAYGQKIKFVDFSEKHMDQRNAKRPVSKQS